MHLQFSPDAFDTIYQALRGLSLNEIRRHGGDELFPELLAKARMNRIAAVNRELARFRRDENQHGIGVRMFVQPCPVKMRSRLVERIGNAAIADMDADASRRSFFRLAYRSADTIAVNRFQGNVTCGAFCAFGAAWKYDLLLNRGPKSPA